MKRKLMALFTVVCVLTSLIAIPGVVHADYTNKWTDSFDTGSGSVQAVSSGELYLSSGDNPLFVNPTVAIKDSITSKHLDVESGVGYNGTAGLHVYCDESASTGYKATALTTRGIVLQDNTAVVLRYRIKFNSIPENTTDSDPFLHLSCVYGGRAYANVNRAAIRAHSGNFETGKWYTIVTKVTGTTATKTATSYVLNEDNTVKSITGLYPDKTITIGSEYTDTPEKQPIYLFPFYSAAKRSYINDFIIDDVSLTEYTIDTTQKIGLDTFASNISNGATDVAINQRFSLTFDHDLASTAPETVKLYKASDTEKASPIECSVTEKKFNSFMLTPANNLEPDTNYVLDFTGVTSATNQTIADSSKTVSFKTAAPAVDPVSFTKAQTASGTEFVENTLTGVTLTDGIKLTFDKEISLPVYGTAVKIYKTADTSATAVDADVALSDDAKTLTVTPSATLSLNTSYTLSFAGVTSAIGGKLEGTNAVTFTTLATRNAIYIQDNLESAATGDAQYYESDILKKSSAYVSIKDNAGFEGSRGIIVDNSDNSGATIKITSKNFDLDESETLFVEYKLKISSISSEGAQCNYFGLINAGENGAASKTVFKIVKSDGNYYLTNQGQDKKLAFDSSKWYTVIMKIGRSSHSGYILDENGNVLLSDTYSRNLNSSVYFNITSISSNKAVSIMNLDNFKVYRVQNDKLMLNSAYSTVTDGMTDVPVTGTYRLVFNQPFATGMKSDEVFSIYEGENKVDADIKLIGGNEIRITPSESLKPGRRYTVKFQTATALSGNALCDNPQITFTTMKIYDVNMLSSNLVISGNAVNSGNKSIVIDNLGEALTNVVVIAAIYGDDRLSTLLGFEMADISTLSAGENTLSINFENSYTNVGKVEFFMYDSTSNLKPLMKSFKVTD